MAGSLKKVGIGVEDCTFEDDELYPASTWQRQGSLGILTGLTKLPNLLISHQTIVNVKYFNSGALTDVSIQAAVDHVGTDERIIYFEPGTWVLSADITGTANIYFQFAPGAYLQPATGITFTAYSPAHIIASPRQQIVDITNNSTDPLAFTNAGSFSAMWWGATGDGTTNDTAALKIPIGLSGTVVIPSGTYLITGNNLVGASNQHLIFEPGAIFQLDTSGGSVVLLHYSSKENIIIDNGYFDINQGADISDIAIQITSSTNVIIRDCSFINSEITTNWPTTQGEGLCVYLLGSWKHVYIENIYAHDVAWGVITQGSSTGSYLTVSGGLIEQISADAVLINVPTGSASDIEVTGLTVNQAGRNTNTTGCGFIFRPA